MITDTHGGMIGVLPHAIAEDRVQSIRPVVNPDKLAHLEPVNGITATIQRTRQRKASGAPIVPQAEPLGDTRTVLSMDFAAERRLGVP